MFSFKPCFLAVFVLCAFFVTDKAYSSSWNPFGSNFSSLGWGAYHRTQPVDMASKQEKCECGAKRCQLEQQVSQQCADIQKALQNPRVRKPVKDAVYYTLYYGYFLLSDDCDKRELELWKGIFTSMHRQVQVDLQTQCTGMFYAPLKYFFVL